MIRSTGSWPTPTAAGGDRSVASWAKLGPCCAEFRHYWREFPLELWKYQVRPGYFDLWQLSFDQLRAAGLKSENIEMAKLCTRCREEEFFSYRRDRVTGRQAAVIGLAP
jgi:hypothetical protein